MHSEARFFVVTGALAVFLVGGNVVYLAGTRRAAAAAADTHPQTVNVSEAVTRTLLRRAPRANETVLVEFGDYQCPPCK